MSNHPFPHQELYSAHPAGEVQGQVSSLRSTGAPSTFHPVMAFFLPIPVSPWEGRVGFPPPRTQPLTEICILVSSIESSLDAKQEVTGSQWK